jgi:hypothetical protein
MMSEFKKIYLQPECCVEDQDVGRMWCQDAINDCEEGNAWTEYLLASDVKQRIAELEAIIRGRDELINNAVSSRIAELEKERDELKVKNATLDNQLHEIYHAMELISKIATVVPKDTAILEVINCYRTGELLQAHNLEQQAKGVEDFVQPYFSYAQGFYGDGLRNAVELRNKAKALKEKDNG